MTWTRAPAFWKPVGGLTVPPVPATVARRYCVEKVTVNTVSVVGATEWLCAPPSLQFAKRYRVSVSPCGEVVAIVCDVVADQTNAWEPV